VKKKQPVAVFHHFRRSGKRVNSALVLVLSIAMGGPGLQAQGPAGGVVRAGDARISGEGTSTTRIDQFSERAVIDWRSFGLGAADQVIFQQPSTQSAILNRVTGEQVSMILGRLDANGQVLLINPNGIVFGGAAQVNVGSLIATTSNVNNANFMSGRLVFDQPGRLGAGVLNAGAITARDGGLVALVAPHVRNDGVIVARLGKIALGAADTFTVDLYGDALINLALSDAHAGQLRQVNGEPVASLVTNTGRIEMAGGQAVLMTARTAKNVLDNLINTSGAIRADSAVQQGGRILLLAEGGSVNVGGVLSAQGTTGGAIQVLGAQVHLSSDAALDASGTARGGTVHVGGAWQGQGDTYRAAQTTVDAGATLKANATAQGDGGELVVWSDGRTDFAGRVEARGGALGGDGGRMEVSGKGTLVFRGQADASASAGQGGSLLLDPAFLDIGTDEASVITRVLRTGTSTSLQADVDINVNSAIFGGDRTAGGGLTMTAGNNININDFVVTNDGAVNLFASQGTVNFAPGKAVFAGSAPITVSAGGDLRTGFLFTGGSMSIASLTGSVVVDSIIDGHTGPVSIRAAGDVDIDQPIVNLAAGSDALAVTAGSDINVNAPVDGRGGAEGGAITMTASGNLNVNEAVVTNNGSLSLAATHGAVKVASGTPMLAGTGAMSISALGDIATGPVSAGSLLVASTAGSVAVDGLIDAATGDARLTAGLDVNINRTIVNGRSGGDLRVSAGRDVNVNALVDGRGGAAGGTVTMAAARHLNVNQSIVTNNGAVDLTATSGAARVAEDKGLFAGRAPIAMRSAGDLTTGAISGGSLSATSTAGSVLINGVIDGNTGRVDLRAGRDVRIDQPVLNLRTGSPLNVTAGRDVLVNAQINGRGGATGGAATLTASRNVAINSAVVTNNGAIDITARGGSATMAPGTVLSSGNGAIDLTARSDITTRGISGGSLSATSTGGSVTIGGVIDGNTGRVDLDARRDVNINQPVLNTRTGSPLNVSAGDDINVNARIDGTGGARGGTVDLDAGDNVKLNVSITTNDANIRVAAENGAATFAPTAGLFAGTGSILVDSFGPVTAGPLSGGAMSIVSRGGSIVVGAPVSGTGGAITFGAAGQVDVDHSITNPGAASPLTITAGTDINVNAQIGRSEVGVASGAVVLTAEHDVTLNDSVVTEDGSISVTAQDGTVTTAVDEGLFAGSGSVTVESGQTLSTPTVGTAGAVILRSTAGSVNVDTPISGETGAVTIAAAADVNVNQGIANPRSDAPLSITAGNDINVNASVDGRDNVLTGPSGAVTMTAGNDIDLNQDIVTNNGPIALMATSGTLTTAATKGLFGGSGAISVTTGGTLNTGITSTTGALNLTSTNGGVNVNTAIADTTGAVTISAATTVNINDTITNLKSGSNLAVTAGADINVLAQVDGRAGVSAGGTVTMTAANDITLADTIATNNGAVSLTATNGALTLPVGVESYSDGGTPAPNYADDSHTPMEWVVSAGNAPITVSTGDNFSLTSPLVTTGALSIASTSGDVNIAAPITDETGAVTITAAGALTVHHQIKSDNQPITLNAGAGGITIFSITDYDNTFTSPVNSLAGNLTLNSVGNVSIQDIRGVASTSTLTVDTRGQIVNGSIGDATPSTSPDPKRPQTVILIADQGIAQFNTGNAGEVIATSSGSSINLNVINPGQLRITTGTPGTLDCPTCDITTGGFLGPDVLLNAGGSVNLNTSVGGTLILIARSGDVNISETIAATLSADAGRDVNLSNTLWVGSAPVDPMPSGGPLTLTAGRDIVTTASSPIHVSNSQTLTLTADRHVILNVLETLGPVNITSTGGNITLNNDIGPHIINTDLTVPDFNPSDLGVASLTMSADGDITMEGARAEGDVVITAGGNLTAAKEITSVSGSRTLNVGGTTTLNDAVPIGNQNQVEYPEVVLPVVAPGPRSELPTPPGVASAGGSGLPVFAEIPVAVGDQNVGFASGPGAAGGAVTFAGTPGGAGAPGGTGGSIGRPVIPAGIDGAQPSGSSDPSALDSASALRAAGLACGEESGSESETGLAALTPTRQGAESDQQKAACPPAESASTVTAGTPAVAADSGGAPAAPIGGSLQ
jgi:filamentous hemagglutinin family protein